MLDLVQLSGFESRRAQELSGGQQQRVALARALVVEPAVLLLDEPLANLDANLRLDMRRLIRSIQQELSITTIFVTHDQEEAVMLADRVALMMDGVLAQYDSPRMLYERPRNKEVARFLRNENFLPGYKCGTSVATEAGLLDVSPQTLQADGFVVVTVRPEHVQIRAAETNCVGATVIEVTYMGTHTTVQARVAGQVWTVHAPADWQGHVGESIPFHLPQERLWLLPESDSTAR
jgi:ABC-type Fe3+/spermidine/putrescine transport system ATPase subunit